MADAAGRDDAVPVPLWGKGGGAIVGWTRVSRQDYEWVKRHRWWLTKDGYVWRSITIDGRKTTIALHREIMDLRNGDVREVDHVDRNPLHNERSNLRVVTRYENEQNHAPYEKSSDWKGVTKVQGNKWKAQASLDGKYVYLGTYRSEAEAGEARAAWDREHRSGQMSVPPPPLG